MITLSWRCYKERRLLQALPLLATQLNGTVIWACLATYQVGQFYYHINGTHIQKDAFSSLRHQMINCFLLNLIYLEPLNLFLYTWRFLSELEQSDSKPAAKTFFKWFARISIIFVPPAFYSIVIAFIVELGMNEYYLFNLKLEEANRPGNISESL